VRNFHAVVFHQKLRVPSRLIVHACNIQLHTIASMQYQPVNGSSKTTKNRDNFMAWILISFCVMTPIALTIWNDIISPVYDAATTFLLVMPDGSREILSTNGQSPLDVASSLAAKKVTTVICGAISILPVRLLSRNHITAVPWIRGNVEEVIEAYRRGILDSPPFRMPGCGCRHHGKGRGRHFHGGKNHLPERSS
jgi:predicted Fe-Mo cluster-binding NifX family protein